ncbi:MAG TPA: hypothetical protein VHA33_25765 [Candidatus Angelobacter sp.]|jgi:hypothetical protein|nr:hypothetical protein [Candidatus Angelobacter sp.]
MSLNSALRFLSIVILSAFCLSASTPTVTLYPPVDPVTKKYDEGKSCFSFKRAQLKEITKSNFEWDLGYGFLSIADEDWFTLHFKNVNRSVIKDLGELDWDKPFPVPMLEPRPPVETGKQPKVTIDSSADTHKAWAAATQDMAKVVLHHMYVLHLKDDADDFYVMFRVEELEQHTRCAISWRRVDAPKPQEMQLPKIWLHRAIEILLIYS